MSQLCTFWWFPMKSLNFFGCAYNRLIDVLCLGISFLSLNWFKSWRGSDIIVWWFVIFTICAKLDVQCTLPSICTCLYCTSLVAHVGWFVKLEICKTGCVYNIARHLIYTQYLECAKLGVQCVCLYCTSPVAHVEWFVVLGIGKTGCAIDAPC